MNQPPPNGPVNAQPQKPKGEMFPPLWAWVLMGMMFVGAIAVVGVLAAQRSAPPLAIAGLPPAVASASAEAEPTSHVANDVEKLLGARSLPEAVALTRAGFLDTNSEMAVGTELLAMWAMNAMLLSDVLVPVDETSYALVRKDPDTARGKRLCASGVIVQIRIARVPNAGQYFTGLLRTAGAGLFRFVAAGSTGELVAHSKARFCGVVTGLYDYANSGGGTGHAVWAVGMFDLPENRAAMANPRPAVKVEITP